jgi:DNA-binding XRE family transcriptional regulator
MDRNWQRLADAVRDARKRRDLRQEDLADLAKVSLGSIQTLERGAGYTRMPRAAFSVAHALGWTTESIDAVLDGGDPIDRERREASVAPPSGSDATARLPLAVRDALSAGELVDTEVLDLGPDDSGMRMIVVVTREERSSEDVEKMRANLSQWTKKKGQLRRIASDSD